MTSSTPRALRKTPIQHTPLSSIGHTHPVYSLAVVGTQNANSLVTVSTDGRLCVWAFESLHQPLEVLELRNKQVQCSWTKRLYTYAHSMVTPFLQSKTVTGGGNVAPTCMAFSEGEVNEFFVGSEEATVYQAYRHGTYALSQLFCLQGKNEAHTWRHTHTQQEWSLRAVQRSQGTHNVSGLPSSARASGLL